MHAKRNVRGKTLVLKGSIHNTRYSANNISQRILIVDLRLKHTESVAGRGADRAWRQRGVWIFDLAQSV